jgi:hypothetical protein
VLDPGSLASDIQKCRDVQGDDAIRHHANAVVGHLERIVRKLEHQRKLTTVRYIPQDPFA